MLDVDVVRQGADFVFFDPHAGFAAGAVEEQYTEIMCHEFHTAMHIVSERSQRNTCRHYWCAFDMP